MTTQTIDYTVRPDNEFTVAHLKPHSDGSVSLDATLPGPGRLQSLVLAAGKGHLTFGVTVKVSAAGVLHVTTKPTARATKLLHTLATTKPHGTIVVVKRSLTFTPTGGSARTVSFRGIRIKA